MDRSNITRICEQEVLAAVRLFGASQDQLNKFEDYEGCANLFDDSCYFWFMYDLAYAWESEIGRTIFRPLAERQDFMKRYMEQVLVGYARENTLSDVWLAGLPLFLRLIQMQELLHFAQYLDEPDDSTFR